MLPLIIQAPITLYTYGVFLLLAGFFGSYLVWRLMRLTSYQEEIVFDVLIMALLIATIFARGVYVLWHWGYFQKLPLIATMAIHAHPGIHELSLIIVFLLGVYMLARVRKLHGHEILAHAAVGIVAAMMFVRLGAFISGAEVGTITDFPIRIKYAGYEGLRHVVGLYEAIFLAGAAGLIYRLLLWSRHHKSMYGMVTAVLLWVSGFVQVVCLPLKEWAIGYKGTVYLRYFDYTLTCLILLTGVVMVVYYLRRHLSQTK